MRGEYINNTPASLLNDIELESLKNRLSEMSISKRSELLEVLSEDEIFREDITKPFWNLSEYSDEIWVCDLKKKQEFIINFRVMLDDGSLLVDKKNYKLLQTFKFFLCALTSRRYNGGRYSKWSNVYRRFKTGLIILDAFLTRSKELRLGSYGLSFTGRNEVLSMMSEIHNGGGSVGAYRVFERLTDFLRHKSRSIEKSELDRFMKEYPGIGWVSEDKYLNLNYEELIRARVWLLKNGFFTSPEASGISGNLITKALYNEVFSNNILTPFNTPIPPELRITPLKRQLTEYDAVPVLSNCNDDKLSVSSLDKYVYVFKKLSVCSGDGFSQFLDDNAFDFTSSDIMCGVNGALREGRFRTIPSTVVFEAIRNGFEFSFKYADAILKAIYMCFEKYKSETVSSLCYEDLNHLLSGKLPACLKESGCKSYSVINHRKGDLSTFQRIRANWGLVELYEVLLGAVFVVLGSVAARRQGEIVDLHIDSLVPCIDPYLPENHNTDFYISFYNRKSGDDTERERLSRPIPRSVAGLIWKLIAFKKLLIKNSLIEENHGLWFLLKKSTIAEKNFNFAMSNSCINTFCDYFETPTIQGPDGKTYRYYIRQHQLRRFFAMAFFWGSGYEGLGTLRYFLGHTDTEHLYRYITENVPGTVLKGVQAQRILYGLSNDDIENTEGLRKLLMQRFGVSDVEIRSIQECIEFLEDDCNEGFIETAPHINELKHQLESNIYQLLAEETIVLEPHFMKIENVDGDVISKVHLTLIIKEDMDEAD
ncbi:hypothetical protein [Neptuniibacter sp.]|uniref:hypothetical protein n=1 Tax=Neptuniibacter sp. TaxID=1962643 RepID=UPI0026023539|nr:hypothetical protein [Neptuniibacter sp.]MCP4597866.1 hypothetical protein [Neptuniibacter sp.]